MSWWQVAGLLWAGGVLAQVLRGRLHYWLVATPEEQADFAGEMALDVIWPITLAVSAVALLRERK